MVHIVTTIIFRIKYISGSGVLLATCFMLLLSLRLLVDLEDGAVLSCETTVKFIRLHGVTSQKDNCIVFHFKALTVSHIWREPSILHLNIIIIHTKRAGRFAPKEYHTFSQIRYLLFCICHRPRQISIVKNRATDIILDW